MLPIDLKAIVACVVTVTSRCKESHISRGTEPQKLQKMLDRLVCRIHIRVAQGI